jgi:hypothetical protein
MSSKAPSPAVPQPFSRTAEELIASLRRLPADEAPRMRRRPTQSLAGLVEDLVVKHSIGRHSPEQEIRDHWSEIVGHANASYSHPLEIDAKGRLIVQTSHAVVRNELFHHRAAILPKVQALAGCDHVRQLQLRSG